MKKVLFLILASILLITSCNMDANLGIFQSAMNSQTIVTEPIEQIIKMDSSSIYFTSSKGIYKFDNTGYSCVVPNFGVNISKSIYINDNLIYFTSSLGTSTSYKISFHKYTNGKVENITSFGLDNDDIIMKIVDENTIFINDKSNKEVYKAKLDTASDKIVRNTESPFSLKYPDEVSSYKQIGVEMQGNCIMFIYYNDPNTPYFKNYLLNKDFTNATAINLSRRVTGTFVNSDGTWITTSFNNSEVSKSVYVNKFDQSGTSIAEFDTLASSDDKDIAIGLFKGNYFFHLAGSNNVNYFKENFDKSTQISSTNYNNFSPKIDFVSIHQFEQDGSMLIPTSQNGIYKLTDFSDPNGFYRINNLK